MKGEIMRKVFIFTVPLAILIAFLFLGSLGFTEKSTKGKFAIILQAGKESHEGRSRALHALLYSKELREQGYEVVLKF